MKKKSAFTFIEVIIAIAVFAVGVLSVLRLITQNLALLDTTQIRTTATFLAKEWIELVYNLRDSNLQKSLPWDCILKTWFVIDDFGTMDPDAVCAWNFSTWFIDKLLQISFEDSWYMYTHAVDMWLDFPSLWKENTLYFTTGTLGWYELFWYSSSPREQSTPTFFSRYILFTGVYEWDKILPRESIVKVESHVLYSKWSKTWEVVLESFIGKY